MKVLVATARTQGARDNDYWPVGTVVERRLDELVVLEIPGDYDLRQLGG